MYSFFKALIKVFIIKSDELSPIINWFTSNHVIQMIIFSILVGFLIILTLKNYMKKDRNYIFTFIILVVLLGWSFHSFYTRPKKIRIECGERTYNWAKEEKVQDADFIQAYLDICLHQGGLSR